MTGAEVYAHTDRDRREFADWLEREPVTRLLRLLWDNRIPASDAEDDLPEGGGYQSRTIPWPGRGA